MPGIATHQGSAVLLVQEQQRNQGFWQESLHQDPSSETACGMGGQDKQGDMIPDGQGMTLQQDL